MEGSIGVGIWRGWKEVVVLYKVLRDELKYVNKSIAMRRRLRWKTGRLTLTTSRSPPAAIQMLVAAARALTAASCAVGIAAGIVDLGIWGCSRQRCRRC